MQDLEVRVDAAGLVALPAWAALKGAVEQFRDLQSQDGSIDAATQDTELAGKLLEVVAEQVGALAPHLPHDAAYLDAVVADLRRWAGGRLRRPRLPRLAAGVPAAAAPRRRPAPTSCVFPMYTQNGSPDRLRRGRAAAGGLAGLRRRAGGRRLLEQAVRADPLPRLHRRLRHQLRRAVPRDRRRCARSRRSPGARSSPTARPPASAGSCRAAAETTGLELPAGAAALLADQALAEETFVMWDLIHDRTHMRGDLPFDPFMIKQRMPYFLYSLEELRCDLTAFREPRVDAARRQGVAARPARAVRGHLRPHLPVPADRQPGAQLRRPRRAAAVRLAAPAPRAALDRQPADHRLGRRARRRARPAGRRSRSCTGARIDRPKVGALARGLRAGRRRYVEPHPASGLGARRTRCRWTARRRA